jgi:ribokinase
MKPAVVVIGSYVQDLAFRCARFPSAGETVVGTFALGPGGKGSNQAVAAARAGAPTCFIGAVGDDAFATEARRFYRAERIDVRFAIKPRHATGTAAIMVNASGENEIVVALGANAALSARDLDSRLLRDARVVVVQHETDLATNAYALRLARRAGVTTILNPAPMRADFDRAVLEHVDVLIPNESEFAALTGTKLRSPSPARFHALCRALGVPTVIVTLGARGCFVSQPAGHAYIPGRRDLDVVDTTGAGDAFVGGFAAGLVKFSGDTLAAARFANAAAALSVTKHGTSSSMPRAAEISRFLRPRRSKDRPRSARS